MEFRVSPLALGWDLLWQEIPVKRVPAATVIAVHVYTAEVGREESVCISIDSYSQSILLSFLNVTCFWNAELFLYFLTYF